jgi:hypothetical protein
MALYNPLSPAYDLDSPFTIRIYKDGVKIVFVDIHNHHNHIYETIHFPWYMKWMITQDIKKFKSLFPKGMFKIDKCPDKIKYAR